MVIGTGTRLFDNLGALATVIANASDDVIFAKDLEGRYRFANPATLQAVGRTLEEVLGHRDTDIFTDPAVAKRLVEADRRVLDSKVVLEIEEAVPGTDGAMRYWLTRKMPLRDDNGEVVGLLGIGRDHTLRKLAEDQRDATRLKLQMGIEAAGLVMAEIDYGNNLNHISAELARLLELGDGPMTVPRQAIFDKIHPDDRERYLKGIAAATDPAGSGHLAIDVRALLPSGGIKWIHILLQVTFGPVEGYMVPVWGICAARDVTAEVTAERKLRASQRLTESVIEGAGALVYAKDLQGRYILSNEAWRTLHGLTSQQAAGITDELIFGTQLAAALRDNDIKVAQTGERILVEERVVLRGQQVTYRSSKFPLYDEASQIYAVCGVSTDITDVVDADRRKDEFIATLAHELRNPLAPIRSGLEILNRIGELPPVAARARNIMERQLKHMVRLVDDLLDVSRITRGKLELEVEPLTLDRVIEHALDASQPAIDAAGHKLSVDLPGQPVHVQGDLTRLAQVVSNLVNNATKYTPAPGHIGVRGYADNGEVVIQVSDNGSGISVDMLPHVFDLFVQAGGRGSSGQGGLGIGLWLVKRLVSLHRGRIEAHSEGVGLGSTFTVRLPAQAQR